MKTRSRLLRFLLVTMTLLATPTRASSWRIVTVAQPVLEEGCVSVRDVPFGDGSFVPGAEVRLTCEPNAIRSVSEGMSGEAENRNAASLFGLSVDVGPVWDGRKFILDTLTVTLDACRADTIAAKRYGRGFAPDSIVEATVVCLRINAARSDLVPAGQPRRPDLQIKYLNLRLLGPARLQRLARLYAVQPPPLLGHCYDLGQHR